MNWPATAECDEGRRRNRSAATTGRPNWWPRRSSPTSRSGPSAPARLSRPTTSRRCAQLSETSSDSWPERIQQLWFASQYGGSVTPETSEALLGAENLDGFFVGGASLDAEQFAAIVIG